MGLNKTFELIYWPTRHFVDARDNGREIFVYDYIFMNIR